ncbi:MAG: hypothetical protein LBT04_02685 [Prevotellaceae bacterium]|jgi:hypothetical protein|nr:hypothetical protein [Prevotellaceae bacterium]
MKKNILLLIPLLFTSCYFWEPYDKKTYFDVEGEGYVYYEDTGMPAERAEVTVYSGGGSGWGLGLQIFEYCYTSPTGYYRVKFLKRTERANIVYTSIFAFHNINGYDTSDQIVLDIEKPILIASGFDPDDLIRIHDEDDKGKAYKYLYDIANKATSSFPGGLLEQLRQKGYDIIIYRSLNSTESLIDNGENLTNFIQEKILDIKTSDEPLIVLGASMGGLTARYALTYMASRGISHQRRLFISMDSPRNGANVPLGFQYMVKYLNDDLGRKIKMLSKAKEETLDSRAAREMIIYHYSATSGQTAKCSPERTTYLQMLESIGNFPKKCTAMAIALGDGSGASRGFTAGSRLINVNPTPFDLAAVTGPLDNAPGSVKGWHNLTGFGYGGVAEFVNFFGATNFDPHYDCFIPSFSTLGLKFAPDMNVQLYLQGNPNVGMVRNNLYRNKDLTLSPFDYLYAEKNGNLDHIYDSNGNGVMSDDLLSAMYYLITDRSSGSSSIVSENKILLLSPNPEYDNITVEYSLSDMIASALIYIYDNLGNLIRQEPLNIGENQINISIRRLS